MLCFVMISLSDVDTMSYPGRMARSLVILLFLVCISEMAVCASFLSRNTPTKEDISSPIAPPGYVSKIRWHSKLIFTSNLTGGRNAPLVFIRKQRKHSSFIDNEGTTFPEIFFYFQDSRA